VVALGDAAMLGCRLVSEACGRASEVLVLRSLSQHSLVCCCSGRVQPCQDRLLWLQLDQAEGNYSSAASAAGQLACLGQAPSVRAGRAS